MLRNLTTTGFKSLTDLSVDLGRLTVLFGPSAAGKSNVIDALQVLSAVATRRTIEDALGPPVRGYPVEMFTLPDGGLDDLLSRPSALFRLGTDIDRTAGARDERFRYHIEIEIVPRTGVVTNAGEELWKLTREGAHWGNARIDQEGGRFTVRANRQGHPRYVDPPINYALVSDPTLRAPYYRDIEAVRSELQSWRSYYLDPASAMRSAAPPSEVEDIGPRGEHLAPFLYRLANEFPERFDAVRRAVRRVIPTLRDIEVELDTRRASIDLLVRQNGVRFSSRVMSEGTLRVIALACIAATPFPAGLVAVEEPENGVHPRRVEVVARFLAETARASQVVVTTHSPTFLAEMLGIARESPATGIVFLACVQEAGRTVLRPFPDPGPLLTDKDVAAALTERSEEAVIEAMYVRGWLDG